jgi:hypothetical protein
MPRASQVERQSRALCVELARVTNSRPMHWRTVDAIGNALGLNPDAAGAAVAHAIGQEWLLGEGNPPHSISLTDAGRIMAQRPARPRR